VSDSFLLSTPAMMFTPSYEAISIAKISASKSVAVIALYLTHRQPCARASEPAHSTTGLAVGRLQDTCVAKQMETPSQTHT
ncbi:MAG: hypothetical protein WCW68_09745, partial [Methanothrix sp.]